jgi:hypothetical protein
LREALFEDLLALELHPVSFMAKEILQQLKQNALKIRCSK